MVLQVQPKICNPMNSLPTCRLDFRIIQNSDSGKGRLASGCWKYSRGTPRPWVAVIPHSWNPLTNPHPRLEKSFDRRLDLRNALFKRRKDVTGLTSAQLRQNSGLTQQWQLGSRETSAEWFWGILCKMAMAIASQTDHVCRSPRTLQTSRLEKAKIVALSARMATSPLLQTQRCSGQLPRASRLNEKVVSIS